MQATGGFFPKNDNQKKLIVVLGKMGHGKSSFIKMFVQQDKDKYLIKSSCQKKSCTLQTTFYKLYKLSEQAKILLGCQVQQQIYILDTPGTNSQANNFIIMEDIKRIILKQKFSIIAIAFIKSATQLRQQNPPNDFRTLFKIFPIKKSIKQQISFFVFTHYDKQLANKKQFQHYLQYFNKIFASDKIECFSNKNLTWISKTDQVQEQMQEMINKDIKKLTINQWIVLKQFLSTRNKIFCSHDQFKKSTEQFNQKAINYLQRIISSKTQSFYNDQIEFNISLKSDYLGLAEEVNSLNTIFKQLPVSLPLSLPFLLGPIAVPIIVGFLGYKGAQMITSTQQQNIKLAISKAKQIIADQHEDQILQKKPNSLNALLIEYFKRIMIDGLLNGCKAQGNYMLISNFYWMRDIYMAQSSRSALQINQWMQVHKHAKIKLLNKKTKKQRQIYEIKMTAKKQYCFFVQIIRPSSQAIQSAISQAALNIYFQN